MKKFLCLIIVGLICSVAFAKGEFSTNVEKTFKDAQKENKLVLMVFSGSDWCPPCKLLEKNVLSNKNFFKKLETKYLFVELDFPKNKQQSAELVKQNKSYATRYKVSAFPTIVVTNYKGEMIYTKSGIPNSSLDSFISWFEREMQTAQKEFATKQAKEKLKK